MMCQNRNDLAKTVATTAALLAAIVLGGCGQAKPEASETTHGGSPPSPLEITADANLLARIKIGQASMASVGASLTVAGRVEVDENRVTRIGSPVMGRINSLTVREGEDVQQGQLLGLLNSTGLSDGQLDLLKALSQKQVAQRAVERARILVDAAVIGSAELQRRE